MVCDLFRLSEDPGSDFQAIPRFKYGTISPDIGPPKTAGDHLLTESDLRLKTMGTVEGSNEASRSEFVFSFLVAGASIFQDIIISPQQPLSGMYGRGPIDFAVTLKSIGILGVTEVKKDAALPKI